MTERQVNISTILRNYVAIIMAVVVLAYRVPDPAQALDSIKESLQMVLVFYFTIKAAKNGT